MRVLLLVLCAIGIAAPVRAQHWALTVADGNALRHLDQSRVVTLDPVVFRAWTRLEGLQPITHASVPGGVFRFMLAERDVDCWAGAWRSRQRFFYSDAGELLFRDVTVEGWRYPYPGTSDHRELAEVCRLLLGARYRHDRFVRGPVSPGDGTAPTAGATPRAVPAPAPPVGIPPRTTPGTRRSP